MDRMAFSLANRGAPRLARRCGRGARRSLRHALRWAAGAVVLVSGGPGCRPGADANRGSFDQVPTVEIRQVEPELLRDVVKFGGQLGSERSVLLKSELEGVVESIEFAEGQRVSEGDILVELHDDEQRARLREAEANLALATSEAKRAAALLSKNAAATAQRDRTRAEQRIAEARVELAKVELRRTKIRAPFDGVVGMRLVARGDFVTDKDSLVQIDAVDRLQAYFAMSEVLLPYATVGYPVDILVSPYPGERFPGKVFYVSPTLDESARRIMVKAWVPNENHKLAAGLYANIEVEIRREENAILLPESAVVADRHGTFVWRVGDEDIAERVPIQVGLRKGGTVEVTLGLHAGDRVVVAGTHKVNEGKKVAAAVLPSAGQASTLGEGAPVGEGT